MFSFMSDLMNFRRQDDDVYVAVPISYSQAVLGGEVEIPTLEGRELFTIPEGTQSGKDFRLPGRGVPHLRGRGRGDLVVVVYIETPQKVSREEEELLRRLAEIEGVKVTPKKRSFFSRKKMIPERRCSRIKNPSGATSL